MITSTASLAIALINAYAAAIIDDTASDSTLDDMQFDIDCILFRDELPADMIEYADYSALTALDADAHCTDLDSIRAFATAAFNLRP